MSQNWMEIIIVPTYKKGDKSECSNYRRISLLPTVSNILVSVLTPYVDEIIRGYYCGFRRNTLTPDQIFCLRQVLEKKGSIMGYYISYL
jgi:hypothetical protein